MNAFRQISAGQNLPSRITADVSDFLQIGQKAESMHDCGIDADTHAGVTRFDALECGSGCECALRDDRHRQATSPAGIP